MFYIFDKAPGSASYNMAVDEYLFKLCHHRNTTFLRLYFWQKPTFSIGVSQKIEKVLDLDFIRSEQFEYVRRVTGGKTVLHDDELTYAVVSSDDLFFKDNDLYKSYLLISKILVQGLNNLKIPAYLHKENNPVLSKSNLPCFSFPTPNEIEINNKKIIGSAQKRDKDALLQHGSIPFSMDYPAYAGGARSRTSILERAMTSIKSVSKISKEQLAGELILEFEKFSGEKLMAYDEDFSNDPEFKALQRKYQSIKWNHAL